MMKIYRVAPSTRFLSASCLVVSGAGLAAGALAPGSVHPVFLVLAALFFILSAAASASNFGDRFEIRGDGLARRNTLLGKRETLLAWDDVTEAKRHGRRTLFVWDKAGKRHVFDCVHPFGDFLREVEERVK